MMNGVLTTTEKEREAMRTASKDPAPAGQPLPRRGKPATASLVRDSRVDPYKPHIFRHYGRWYQWTPERVFIKIVVPNDGSWTHAPFGGRVFDEAAREGKIIGGRVHHYGRD